MTPNLPPPASDSSVFIEVAHSGRMAPPPASADLGDWLLWAADTGARTFATDFTYYLLTPADRKERASMAVFREWLLAQCETQG